MTRQEKSKDMLVRGLAACDGIRSELARKIGTSPTIVSRWIHGQSSPSLRFLVAIGKLVGDDPEAVVREFMEEEPAA